MNPPLIVIAGPTAAGKTAAAIGVALALGGEIISADSVQVYRRLDIGSAKPTPEELKTVPHHLIDVVEPDEPFSGGTFQSLAREVVLDLERRGKPVVVCGGTGLYIRALVWGLFPGPAADPALRSDLERMEDEHPGMLHARLLQRDQHAAARLHPNDRVRLIRALEVLELTGKTITDHHREHQEQGPFRETRTFVVDPPREVLEERIRRRAAVMIEAGLVEEVRGLLAMGYGSELRSLQSVGYRQGVEYLTTGETAGVEQLTEAVIRAHLKYVKQQRTWFAREGIHIGTGDGLPMDELRTLFGL